MSVPLASATDVISVLLSAAAFFVSAASLWFASLRWPQIEVDRLEDTVRLTPAVEWRRAMPLGCVVSVDVLVANTGAGGTVVQQLSLKNLEETSSDDQKVWVRAIPGGTPEECELLLDELANAWDERHPEERGRNSPAPRKLTKLSAPGSTTVPFVLEPRGIKALAVGVVLNPDNIPAEEFARRLRALRSAQVLLVWTFRRPKWPTMRRKTIEDSEIVSLPIDSFRKECIRHWEWFEGRDDLANIARGTSS